MLACWVEDPNGDAFKKHLPRIQDYLWMAEDGMRMQSFGSQSWDTSLGLQALLASGLHEEIWETLKKGHFFVKESQRQDWSSSRSASSSIKDCILLAACGAHGTLPQSAEFPADVFTSCLTTPINMFCGISLLRDTIDQFLIDRIPDRQNDRKTLLGELNWIFTAVNYTIAWNVLPHDLFQRLFRQDLLVASLFRNFLLTEWIMRSANCSPISYPVLPSTHQHHMWDAWDMAAEICLSQLSSLIEEPNVEFQPSLFFTEQLTAF